MNCDENCCPLNQVVESRWILLANIFSANGVPIAAEFVRLQVVALWRFGAGLQQKLAGLFGAMPTPATGQTPYIQRYQSGPVIVQAHLSVGG
jgi:hypothetical protein